MFHPSSKYYKGNTVNQVTEIEQDAESGEINGITNHCNNISSCNKISPPTPRFMSEIYQEHTYKGDIPILPDSGSVANIMSLQTATQLQLSLVKVNSNIYDLRAANGSTIQIEYKVDIGIKIDNEHPIANISCLVSSQLNSRDLTISWETMSRV